MDSLLRGGQLIYILDIAFFETAFVDLRKYLVDRFRIDELVIELNAFENVASGQLILKVSKNTK